MRKLILFDIDGTLLRSGPAPVLAFDRAFSELFGVASAWAGTRAHGRTDPCIIEEISGRTLGRALLPAEYERLCVRYVEHFEGELQSSESFALMPGVLEICQLLAQRNDTALGLETGNIEPAAWLKLARGSLAELFQFGGFGSDNKDRKEIVRIAIERGKAHCAEQGFAVEEVYVIGDAPQDIQAALAAGAKAIAVATGKSGAEELARENPWRLLESLGEQEAVLEALELV